jgi:hypothetical protein
MVKQIAQGQMRVVPRAMPLIHLQQPDAPNRLIDAFVAGESLKGERRESLIHVDAQTHALRLPTKMLRLLCVSYYRLCFSDSCLFSASVIPLALFHESYDDDDV